MGRDCPTEESKTHRFTDECNLKIKASRDKPNLGLDTGAPLFRSARCTRLLKMEGYCSLRIGIGLALGSGCQRVK